MLRSIASARCATPFAEATFFEIYGNLAAFYLQDEQGAEAKALPADPRELSFVKEALASIDKGGYAEALARVAFLMAHKDEPLPLSRLQLAHDLLEEYRDFLPDLPIDEARRIGGEQEIIARYEPEKAVETLPLLLSDANDRDRLLTLLDRVLARQARAKDSAIGRAERDARTNSRRARIRRRTRRRQTARQRIRKGGKGAQIDQSKRQRKRVARNATPAGH